MLRSTPGSFPWQEDGERATKLESTARVARRMAHDFNNTLGAIALHAQLLAGSVPPESEASADVEAILATVKAATETTRLVGQLGVRDGAERDAVDLNRLLAEAEHEIRALAPPDVSIVLHSAPREVRAWVTAGRAGDMLRALVHNAVEALHGVGGTVSIEVAASDHGARTRDDVRGADGNRYHMLAVGDTGPGIDPGLAERLFEPFATTKPDRRHRGLGLALTYWHVAQSSGFIDVSTAERGTRFTVYLPAVVEAAASFGSPDLSG